MRPPAATLDQLSAALDVTIDELLGVKPVKEKPPVKKQTAYESLQILEKLPKEDQKAVVN